MRETRNPEDVIRTGNGREVLLRGDGRVLRPEGEDSLWERFIRGEPVTALHRWLVAELALDGQRARS